MIRFDLRLLSLEENAGKETAVNAANEEATLACNHLKKLIGKRKCRKHPSSPNKIRITASLDGGPKAELLAYCCPDFVKRIK